MGQTNQSRFIAALVMEYGKRLQRFLALHTRNGTDTEDLAQEVFLRLLRVKHHEAIQSPEAYLFTVASHLVHQQSLREGSIPPTVDIDETFAELPSGEDPADSADIGQRIEDLKEALSGLPPRYAVALVLHRFEGRTIEEIARQLGVAHPTAKKYIARALLHCREHNRSRGTGA